MSTLNDELYDQHEDDLDDDLDDDEDHALDSDIALDRFTDRAMRHGRRAATCLLVGLVAEAAVIAGTCYAVTSVRSLRLIVPAAMMTSVVMFMVAGLINIRWDRHRAKMESVIGEAMGWRSDVQQKRENAEQAHTRRHLARIEDERLDALREEMTWSVGPAPVYIDAEGHGHPTAEQIALEEHAQREAGDLFDSLDRRSDEHDGDAESDNAPDAPDSPAVQAWMQRWADVKPVKQSRPAPLLKRHTDAEGRCRERELCRSISRHWDGAFHRLIAEGTDVNGHNGSGQPLRKAVLHGRLEHISWLLTLGADPNRQAFGRTMLATLMVQVDMQVDEGDGSGDDFEWPEIIELLARFGANPHIKNEHYDSDSDAEGPTAWPFICRYPVLYEAFMKGHNAWLQADLDARRLLAEARGLAEVADVTRAMLDTARMGRT